VMGIQQFQGDGHLTSVPRVTKYYQVA